jgi:glyoxylase-like metal-dependent hydrolase (beta-lactamase superfamily II)
VHIEHFFDEHTSTLTYVVHDGSTAVVIDPPAHADHLTALPFFRERYGARMPDYGSARCDSAARPPAARSRGPEAGRCRL